MINDIKFYKKNNYLKAPKIVQIEITNKCPLSCAQCYKSPKPKNMSMDKFVEIIDECSVLGVNCVMLNGGEPMVHPDVIKMIEYASKKNIITYCFLSGYGIDYETITQLKACKINISISLNGITKVINDISRDGYQYSLNAIKLLQHSDINWGINWVARHDNLLDFNNLVNFAINNGAKFINIIANKINGKELISPMDYYDYELLKKYINKNKNKIAIRVESCFSIMNAFMNVKSPSLYKGCIAGKSACFIDVNGNYWPCSHLFYPEKFNSLSEYWENSKYLKKIRNIDTKSSEYCKDCKLNINCRFCRAISYKTTIDFNVGFADCPVAQK